MDTMSTIQQSGVVKDSDCAPAWTLVSREDGIKTFMPNFPVSAQKSKQPTIILKRVIDSPKSAPTAKMTKPDWKSGSKPPSQQPSQDEDNNSSDSDNGDGEGEVSVDFKVLVTNQLSEISRGLFGEGKKYQSPASGKCLMVRVDDVEKEVFGDTDSTQGLKYRVGLLEERDQGTGASGSSAAQGAAALPPEVAEELKTLRSTNAVMTGFVSKLQKDNTSMRNQLYVQQDRLNFLNLNLGGVATIDGKSPIEECVEFFKKILKINGWTKLIL